MLGVAFYHRPRTVQMVGQRRVWHAIIAYGQHTRLNKVLRGMPALPWDNAHGQTTLSVTCHYNPWTAHTVEGHWAWHVITVLG